MQRTGHLRCIKVEKNNIKSIPFAFRFFFMDQSTLCPVLPGIPALDVQQNPMPMPMNNMHGQSWNMQVAAFVSISLS